MNKQEFWEIVESVRKSTDPKNHKEVASELQSRLRKLPTEEIVAWKDIFHFYQDAANRNDLWAASAAMGAHCSDDGFNDFRSWLISQGREIYVMALADPDSLADVDASGQSLNFESYAYAPNKAYAERMAYEEMSTETIITKYIEWAEWYEQGHRERLKGYSPAEGKINSYIAEAFMRGFIERKYDMYAVSKSSQLDVETLEDLLKDIPDREDISPHLNLDNLARFVPRIYRKYAKEYTTWSAKAPLKIPAGAAQRKIDAGLMKTLGCLPCSSQEELRAFQARINCLTADEETVLTAQIMRHDPKTAARVLELLDEMSEYQILKGVSNYEELGKYHLINDMDVPQDLHQYMNLYALGCRYEDEHPGLFVGDDYVAYPAEAPEQEMKLEMT